MDDWFVAIVVMIVMVVSVIIIVKHFLFLAWEMFFLA